MDDSKMIEQTKEAFDLFRTKTVGLVEFLDNYHNGKTFKDEEDTLSVEETEDEKIEVPNDWEKVSGQDIKELPTICGTVLQKFQTCDPFDSFLCEILVAHSKDADFRFVAQDVLRVSRSFERMISMLTDISQQQRVLSAAGGHVDSTKKGNGSSPMFKINFAFQVTQPFAMLHKKLPIILEEFQSVEVFMDKYMIAVF